MTSHSKLGVSPDDATIAAHFFSDAEGTFVTGHDTADGAELWRIPLQGGRDHVTTLYPVFSHDARTAYLTSSPVGLSILYAIDISSGECYADCDISGGLDFFDFLCFQNQFAATDPRADCDGSGEFDFFDFLCFQSAFAGGCL